MERYLAIALLVLFPALANATCSASSPIGSKCILMSQLRFPATRESHSDNPEAQVSEFSAVQVSSFGQVIPSGTYNSEDAATNLATMQKAIYYAVSKGKRLVKLPCSGEPIWISQPLFADAPDNSPPAVLGSRSIDGVIELTVSSTAGWSTNDRVVIWGVQGTTEANGYQTITVVDRTHITLQSASYVNAFQNSPKSAVYNPKDSNFSVKLQGCGGPNRINAGTVIALAPNLNAPGIVFGPGRGMEGEGFSVRGTFPGRACAAALPTQSVGIGYAGGGSNFVLRDVGVYDAYKLFDIGLGRDSLADRTTLENIDASGGYYGFYVSDTESFINELVNTSIAAIFNVYTIGPPVSVRGGGYATIDTHANAFPISNASILRPSGSDFRLSMIVSSPDKQIAVNCYSAFVIKTAHFGPVPFTLVDYSGGSITLQVLRSWYVNNFGDRNAALVTDLAGELRAAMELYAVEKYTVFCGGVDVQGVHVEGDVPMTLWDTEKCITQQPIYMRNIRMNTDPSNTRGSSCLGANSGCEARFLAAQTHPFFSLGNNDHSLQDFYSAQAFPKSDPFIVDAASQGFAQYHFDQLYQSTMVMRWCTFAGNDDHEQYSANRYKGAGHFDRDYWLMQNTALNGGNNYTRSYQYAADNQAPFVGFRPAPWTTPMLTPNQYHQVSGPLPPMGTYPLVHGGTIYQVGKEGDAGGRQFVTSSHQFYSWGQNLSIGWVYKGAANWVAMSDTSQMFAGLAITLDLSGVGKTQFVVTGVYPHLGGVTIAYPGKAGSANDPVIVNPGMRTTVYTGSIIIQAPYSWTSVTLQ
jgi:hypothetical protein